MRNNWRLVTEDGFGNPNNEGYVGICSYDNKTIIGTWDSQTGCGVYESDDGLSWEEIATRGFGDINNFTIAGMVYFNEKVYAATWNQNGGQLWRKSIFDTIWEPITLAAFGMGSDYQTAGTDLKVIQNRLYTTLYTPTNFLGPICMVSDTGDPGDWYQVGNNNYDSMYNFTDSGLLDITDNPTQWDILANTEALMKGKPYVGGKVFGLEEGGSDWYPISEGGFGNSNNVAVTNGAYYRGFVYFGTWNIAEGAEIYAARPQEESPWNWIKIFSNGGGLPDQWIVWDMKAVVTDDLIYATSCGRWAAEPDTQFWRTVTEANGGYIWRLGGPYTSWNRIQKPPLLDEFDVGYWRMHLTPQDELICLNGTWGHSAPPLYALVK